MNAPQSATALLDYFRQHDIALEVDGDKLRCKAPKGFLTPELLASLQQHKPALIALLAPRIEADADRILPRAAGRDVLPLSTSQRQLWFLDQLAPGNPFYNNPAAIGLRGQLDVAALERALNAVIARHESLRTRFSEGGSEPLQTVLPALHLVMPVQDLTQLAGEARQAAVAAATEAAAREPFDLGQGPLLRSRLLKLAEDDYRWLLNVHHIVADGWSIGILINEVAQLYTAFVNGQPSPLPPLPIQYPDYALWQQQQTSRLQHQLAYWTQQLADAPTLLTLPTDRPRPAVQRFQGRCHHCLLPIAVVQGLKAVSQSQRATLFMSLMAGFAVLLWRYSGQSDLCIGTPFANRNHREVEGLIGHFINPLVIRHQLVATQTFSDLLQTVRDTVLDAYAHADLPFDQLVEALKPVRHTSHSPLFQVMLVLQNMPRGQLDLPGLTLFPQETGTDAAKFDLSVEAAETTAGLQLTFEYNTDLFDAASIERLAGHFMQLLRHAAADPSQTIARLPLLDATKRQCLLHDWNATAVDYGTPAGLPARFAAQVRERPSQTALVCEGQSLSYAELDRQSHQLANHLQQRGIGRDQRVGLHFRRSNAMVVAMLGVLKAGAAWLPLDPAYPAERLDYLVSDAAPALVLTDDPARSGLWQSLAALLAEPAPELALPPVQADDLAYVIYTSGSTGLPKGVAMTHASVANLLDHWQQAVGALPGKAAALWSSFGFDVSVHETLLPLTTGGTLHIVPEAVRIDPQALMRWLAQHQIAQAYLPPAFVRWLDEAPAERLDGLALQQLLVGVEPLQEQSLYHLQQQLPGLRIVNGYGPTETCVYSTVYLTLQPLARQCPIGRPLANTQVYLLDAEGEPVPIGVTGELYIGGAGLARGYLHRTALTDERFVPNPFSQQPGSRLYRTGDLARWLPEGQIEYLGRRDQQVKLRGYRVEPGEVEAALLAQADVREAAVLIDRPASGEARLVAALVRADGAAPRLASEWREVLAQRLPAYMIPSLFVELPQLPQTAHGKLDTAAILALAADGPRQVNVASPRDHIELTLYQLWKQVLLQPHISIRDNFFDIGGTSIAAIKLAHGIAAAFGETLPVRDILLHPTIEALGGRLRHGAGGKPPSNLIEFRQGDGQHRVVCIHPAGGTAFCYLSLAKVMPDDCGIYGIQSPGVNPGEAFLPTVEAMAQSYLEKLGPLTQGRLVLTGLSYGGLIAHEMGRRLAAAGHRQLSVVLLDTQGLEDPAHRAMVMPVEMEEFRSKLVKFNGMYPGIDDAQVAQYFHIYNHNRLTMRDYLTPPTAARLVLIQAMGGRDRPFWREARAFWRRRAQAGFLVKLVHGDHWEMLETAEVLRVAKVLRGELARLARQQAREA
ncbi:non-ribosomal peptide synthetase [Parachitinimonas caeni]|uniref:Amino acid adenylation domain-containing protein n=1 Tax=Parachitinimonas caeni TaxID=3031301 RepID=A0ABT7E3P5_9NEIS|nr:amino acid adenylation domain-containing protein [Parachitinimonas caeni]MDK2126025.1 amino acid adenylation domain-containing protein [Parachitinimonas caeni]